MKTQKLLLVVVLSAVLAAEEIPARSALSVRALNEALIGVAEHVTPAVAMVIAEGYQQVAGDPAGVIPFGLRRAGGSGVIVSSNGYIVTNAHVIAGATRIQVQLSSNGAQAGRSIVRPPGRLLAARLVGLDAETDLALLKVEAEGLRFLELADSDIVRQGQLVVAVGSPNGLESSMSMGVISAVARQLRSDDRVIYLQTDAPINPGNSGGALVDIEGHLVGINTMILTQSGGSEGLGFAVPSNIVRFVVDQMRRSGFVLRGEIGVEAQTVTPGPGCRTGAGARDRRDSGGRSAWRTSRHGRSEDRRHRPVTQRQADGERPAVSREPVPAGSLQYRDSADPARRRHSGKGSGRVCAHEHCGAFCLSC